MATVTQLVCVINTHDTPGSGTTGDVYLGVGGREFRLDTAADDFEQGDSRYYILGNETNVRRPNENDPRRSSVLDTDKLDGFPVYIRMDPESAGDHWRLRSAALLVYRGASLFTSAFVVDVADEGLVMGRNAGKVIHLPKVGQSEATLLETVARRP